MLLLPPSSGRRWRVAPEVGFALFRLQPTPCPSGIPLPWEGGRVTHPTSPSFLWKEVARSAGGWLCSFSLSANPRPSGISLPWEGGGLLTPLLPPSSGRRWRVAPEVGFALFRLRPTPALRASPFHGKGVDGLLIPLLPPLEGGGAERRRLASLFFDFGQPPPFGHPPSMGRGRFLTASPAFLRKEKICYLNSLQRSSKTSWLGFST